MMFLAGFRGVPSGSAAIDCGRRRSGSPFERLIREDRIVLAGHSNGGSAALLVAAARTLNVVAIGLLASGSASGAAARVEAPILLIRGTEEGAAGGDRDGPYRDARPPKHLVIMDGGNHFGFTDAVCIEEGDPPAAIARSDQQRCAFGYLTAFLESYVRGENATGPSCGATAFGGDWRADDFGRARRVRMEIEYEAVQRSRLSETSSGNHQAAP